MLARMLIASLTALTVALILVGPGSASATASADLLRPDVTCLGSNVASVRFNWTPAPNSTQQWLDLSTKDQGWPSGSFMSAGPLDSSSASYTWQGLKSGAPHYWRINSMTPDGWVASSTASFIPCPMLASAGNITFKFGDGVSDVDQGTIRASIDSLRAYSLQTLGVDASKMSVYAYDDLNKLAEEMATWLGEPSYFGQMRAMWVNTNITALTVGDKSLGDAFFIYAGGPVWKTTTSGDIYRLIGHEYFHVLQRQLSGDPNLRGPTWLTEGSAEMFGWWAYLAKAGLDPGVIHDGYVHDSAPYAGTLKALEDQTVFNASGYAAYANGLMAANYAVKGKSMRPIADFYRSIGQGVAWEDAFAQAFGVTPDFFYSQFEAYKANGFK